jgi:hypothetical protein
MRVSSLLALGLVVSLAGSHVGAQPAAPATTGGYLQPPKVIIDLLDAPPLPTVELSPTRDVVAVLERASMPTIAELAQPMLRLAGARINPRTNGLHRAQTARRLALKDVATGVERAVTFPAQAPKLTWLGFSADGKRFAFTHTRDTGIELWMGDTATGQAKALTAAQLNATMGAPCSWIGSGTSLLCAFVDANRGQPPAAPEVPTGPNIQENRDRTAPVRTYEDLLTSAYDETLFEYYATSQLAVIDADSGQRTPVGRPGIYRDAMASPDGNHVLVARVRRPFSWLVPYRSFPTSVEIWDRRGTMVKQLADLPTADTVPNNGVLPGPRSWQWNPLQPATVAWVEALDGGDPKRAVPHRDKVLLLAAPFSAQATELARTEHRYAGLSWSMGGTAFLSENDRTRRWTRTWLIDAVGAQPRKLWDRSQEDQYKNPGSPLQRVDFEYFGHRAIRRHDLLVGQRRGARRRAAVPGSTESQNPAVRACVPDGARWLRARARRAQRRRVTPPDTLRIASRSADIRRAECHGQHASRAHHRTGACSPACRRRETARDIYAQGRRPALGNHPHTSRLDGRAGPTARLALGVPEGVRRSEHGWSGDRLGRSFHRARLEHVAPALPHAGLRCDRRSDDADCWPRRDRQ